ncbi:MBL fold metallo-hydrolase [Acuticoccus mangrovi]|uniref:MBL fold metallo-hydrolase n=1 Tax=Acuticoccus mangrovi TaxID=2796142 RepID=A0A934MKN2_9HYPH|nr:MBL fold metallo-hydrolase [Acuticoccus mangrovi]MBJ3775619.1 MBL fold metallo-hydrolase [Acuticoccus mangrovi]
MSEASSTPSPLSIRLLGTGGPWVNPKRYGPSALISVGEERLLFDTGRGVGIRLVEAGEDPGRLSMVFLTHHHLDHISDLGDIMITSWLRGRSKELVIYGPTGTAAIVDALLTKVYAKDIEWRSDGEPTWGGWQPVRAIDVGPGVVIDTGAWRVSCEEVVHGHALPFRPEFLETWRCLGYRFEAGGKVITLSGDTVDCEGVRRLAKGADVLVHCCFAGDAEVAHSKHLSEVGRHTLATASQVARVARDSGVGHLVLTHLRPKPPEMIEALRGEVRAIYDGEVTVGEDLHLVSLA